MKAIVTVTGLDHPGIIAAVANALAGAGANILNVSQTLMGAYFTMIMEVEFDESAMQIETLQGRLNEVGQEQGLKIRIQAQALFEAMHRI